MHPLFGITYARVAEAREIFGALPPVQDSPEELRRWGQLIEEA